MRKGLPSTLWHTLQEVLMECPEMRSYDQILAVMEVESLKPFQRKLNRANNIEAQVDFVIFDLLPHSIHGQNALVSFLDELQHRHKGSDLAVRLLAAREQLALFLRNDGPDRGDEANPQRRPLFPVKEREKMVELAKGVAIVRNARNQGTAWLIAPDIAISCQHVFGDVFTDALLTFDFLEVGRGISYKVEAELISTEWDFVLLRVQDRKDHPLKRYPYLPVEMDPQLVPHIHLWIIQHPLNESQREAEGTFKGRNEGTILYDTPTEPGSSGAPVFNRTNLHVVAMHQGEHTKRHLRQGLLIGKLMSILSEEAPSLYEEIMRAQQAIEHVGL